MPKSTSADVLAVMYNLVCAYNVACHTYTCIYIYQILLCFVMQESAYSAD